MKVMVTEQAVEDLQVLPEAMMGRFDDVVARLEKWPDTSGMKRLTGQWKGRTRIRMGDYRVIFHLLGQNQIVVDRVAHRKLVYAD